MGTEFSLKLKMTLFGAYDNVNAAEMTIVGVLTRKATSTEDDVMLLTGLNPKDYKRVFKEDASEDQRAFRLGLRANRVLTKHVNRDDLLPVQKQVSLLFWKLTRAYYADALPLLFGHGSENGSYKNTKEDYASALEAVMKYVEEADTQSLNHN